MCYPLSIYGLGRGGLSNLCSRSNGLLSSRFLSFSRRCCDWHFSMITWCIRSLLNNVVCLGFTYGWSLQAEFPSRAFLETYAGYRAKCIQTNSLLTSNVFFTTAVCFLAYFGVSTVMTLMWPYKTLPKDGTLPNVFALRGAPWAKYIIAVGALCGLTSSLLGALVPLPRMLYSMASDGIIFK